MFCSAVCRRYALTVLTLIAFLPIAGAQAPTPTPTAESSGESGLPDINGDGIINGVDVLFWVAIWQRETGSDGFPPGLDVDETGIYDSPDLVVFLEEWLLSRARGTATPTPTPTETPTPPFPAPRNLTITLGDEPWPETEPIHLHLQQFEVRITWDPVEATEPILYLYRMEGVGGYVNEATRSVNWIRPFVFPQDVAHGGTPEDDGQQAWAPGDFVWSVQAKDALGQLGGIARSQLVLTNATATPTPRPEDRPNPDQDGNGSIEGIDLFFLAARWNATSGMEEYLLKSDLETDGRIDAADMLKLIESYSETILGRPEFVSFEIRANPAGVPPRTETIWNPFELRNSLTIAELANSTFFFNGVDGAVDYLFELFLQIDETTQQSFIVVNTGGAEEIRFPLEHEGGLFIPTLPPPRDYVFVITPITSSGATGQPSIPLLVRVR